MPYIPPVYFITKIYLDIDKSYHSRKDTASHKHHSQDNSTDTGVKKQQQRGE